MLIHPRASWTAVWNFLGSIPIRALAISRSRNASASYEALRRNVPGTLILHPAAHDRPTNQRPPEMIAWAKLPRDKSPVRIRQSEETSQSVPPAMQRALPVREYNFTHCRLGNIGVVISPKRGGETDSHEMRIRVFPLAVGDGPPSYRIGRYKKPGNYPNNQ